ncbi:transcription termination factor 1, mitochondrial-like [Trematomus bernacchii]|uniref:transcription termination factor 1, mitochondrial-like n=1 Tax=Trematomus bernacchii TaxID=40690 RepID=UPI001469D62A|nr:transcription termination factor 1, mitochondrial-like [Trematomus bernacchii]XP_033980319.1 transcription termination factor 1, mitochondrial-like [Trematomus bernacchii]
MAALPGVRALQRLHQPGTFQRCFGLIPVQLTPTCLPRRLCTAPTGSKERKQPDTPENVSLVENLTLMGVDLKMARLRQPGVLRKAFTNEQAVALFLDKKGAPTNTIASIISRCPRTITRSVQHLEQRWEVWRKIFNTDDEIVSILYRSPEYFFRSSNIANLDNNITFLTSLGLNTKDLHRLLTTAPRTFSNSLELNKQRVAFLKEICAELGGKNPEQFPKVLISRDFYILTRSTKNVRTNIDFLRASLTLSNSELLNLFQRTGAKMLYLPSEYLKNNVQSLEQKMVALGCQKAGMKELILSSPIVLLFGQDRLSTKLDCLLKGGITMKQIMGKPKLLHFRTQNILGRLEELKRVGYDFQEKGINVLDSSQKCFVAKIARLDA